MENIERSCHIALYGAHRGEILSKKPENRNCVIAGPFSIFFLGRVGNHVIFVLVKCTEKWRLRRCICSFAEGKRIFLDLF